MAKPRLFISSTYYDLKVVRADLERFIREMGYEAVLFEKGHVAYGIESPLEDYCYREVSSCDMLVAIIGGKYGTQSRDEKNSITQREIKSAIDLGKQIYIFIEKPVWHEFRTYQHNKDIAGFRPVAVNDKRVYEFIDEITNLPVGNPIEPFETSDDISRFLKEQWSGLFQRLLQESERKKEYETISSLKATASTLKQLVTFLTEERSKGDEAIKDILLSSHPAFATIRQLAKIPYRVIFYNKDELNELLCARTFVLDDITGPEGFTDWNNKKAAYGIRVSNLIFDENNKLKPFTPEEWEDEWIYSFPLKSPPAPPTGMDDDIPF